MIILWAKNNMNDSPENIIGHIKNLIYDTRLLAVKRYHEQNGGI
jgi:hypothetical protein